MDGAFFFKDEKAMNLMISLASAGVINFVQPVAILNARKLDIPTSYVCSVRGAHAMLISLSPSASRVAISAEVWAEVELLPPVPIGGITAYENEIERQLCSYQYPLYVVLL